MTQNIWYSFQGKYPYTGPYFYSKGEFVWTKKVEQEWPIIKDELLNFLNQNQGELVPYFNQSLSSADKKWKAVSFLFWNFKLRKNYRQVPNTMKVLEQIPGLVSASISMLEPHTAIKPHYGDTNAIVRCHLGLIIPAGLPECGFQVGEEKKEWEQGQLLLFNDGEYHQAWNNTGMSRYLLLFDVIRPEFLTHKKAICATVLTSLIWQFIMQRLNFLNSVPRPMRKLFINSILRPLVIMGLGVRSLFHS